MVCGAREVQILKRCRRGLSVVSGIECAKEGCESVGGSYLGLLVIRERGRRDALTYLIHIKKIL